MKNLKEIKEIRDFALKLFSLTNYGRMCLISDIIGFSDKIEILECDYDTLKILIKSKKYTDTDIKIILSNYINSNSALILNILKVASNKTCKPLKNQYYLSITKKQID